MSPSFTHSTIPDSVSAAAEAAKRREKAAGRHRLNACTKSSLQALHPPSAITSDTPLPPCRERLVGHSPVVAAAKIHDVGVGIGQVLEGIEVQPLGEFFPAAFRAAAGPLNDTS